MFSRGSCPERRCYTVAANCAIHEARQYCLIYSDEWATYNRINATTGMHHETHSTLWIRSQGHTHNMSCVCCAYVLCVCVVCSCCVFVLCVRVVCCVCCVCCVRVLCVSVECEENSLIQVMLPYPKSG